MSKKKSPPSQPAPSEANIPEPKPLKPARAVKRSSIIKTSSGREEAPWEKHLKPGAAVPKRRGDSPDETSTAANEKTKSRKKKVPKASFGEVVRLPPKAKNDSMLRLEQNFGCEFSVCVANRRDVKNDAIEMRLDNGSVLAIERTSRSLLPAPEHNPLWLVLLDMFQAAAHAGHTKAPRIAINLQELAQRLGRQDGGGRWYADVDEGLSRFGRAVVTNTGALHMPDGEHFSDAGGALGTLIHYQSWRPKNATERKALINGKEGWVQPGPFIWASILSGYLKAVPLGPVLQLPAFVAQRLYLHLHKHCRPGGQYKVSTSKLLSKIPLSCPANETKRQLKKHHQALCDLGFLACEPVYEGRGESLMVTYQR